MPASAWRTTWAPIPARTNSTCVVDFLYEVGCGFALAWGKILTEEEWDATDQGCAASSFIKTTISLAIVYASAELGSSITNRLGPLAQWALANANQPGTDPRVVDELKSQKKYLDMLDPEHDRAVRSSLIIIGACSAIEAFIERFTKNRIREDPSLLAGTEFGAAAIAQRRFLTHPEAVLEGQWRAIKASPGRASKQHERFESVLKSVGRDGPTPQMIVESVNIAYAYRNVWGHNAGFADAQFISRVPPELAVNKGDLVSLTREDAQRYLSVIMTYGMIVANRERFVYGIGPIPMEGKPGEAPWGRVYSGLYNAQ